MNKSTENMQEPQNAGNLFLKGAFILTMGGIVVKVIGSLNWIILSRVIGGEGIGLYQMAFPLYLLALNISSAGIPVAISIMTAERIGLRDFQGAKRIFHLSLAFLMITGLVLSFMLYLTADWLITSRIIRDPRAYYSLLALSPAIFFVTILSSFRGYLQGWQIMTPTAVSQIVEQAVRVAAMVLFATLLLPQGLEYAAGGASLGAAVGAAAGLLVLLYYYHRVKSQHEWLGDKDSVGQPSSIGIIKRIFSLAWPVSLASIMLPLVANLDMLIVPRRLEDAGYSVEQSTEFFGYLTGMAVPLVNLATIVTAALATSIVPAVAQAYSIGDGAGVRQRLAAAIRLTYLVTLPAVVILFLLAEPIAATIYNAPQAAGAIQVMALSVFWLGLHQVSTGALQGMGLTLLPVINMGFAAVIKVALNWTLTAMPSLGIEGAAWATVADIGIAALLNIYWIKRHADFSVDTRNVLKSSFAALIMAVVIYVAYGGFGGYYAHSLPAAFIAVVAGGLVYGVVQLAIGGIGERDLARIPLIGEKLLQVMGHVHKKTRY